MTPLISGSYRELIKKLDDENEEFSSACIMWASLVAKIAVSHGFSRVLDYGAGKGRLAAVLAKTAGTDGLVVINYEPARPEWSARPEPCEFVVCLDVLEHVESECLEAVLEDLARCVEDTLFLTIAHWSDRKVLADGRTAHAIQQQIAWWRSLLTRLFEVDVQWDYRDVSAWLCRRSAMSRERLIQ